MAEATLAERVATLEQRVAQLLCKGNSNAILPMTTVVGISPFHSGETHAERSRSAAGAALPGT
jgi:hypothetical protein